MRKSSSPLLPQRWYARRLVVLLPLLATLLLLVVAFLHPTASYAPPPPAAAPLFSAWRRSPESCAQWVSAQRAARAYVDAYIIGAQKASTSALSRRMYDLRVLHKHMRKEWFLLQNLHSHTPLYPPTAMHRAFTHPDIEKVRLMHLKSGFPTHNLTSVANLVDDAPQNARMLVYDASIDAMLSARVAHLAYLLNPHAKIVALLRHPVERAISQYNMIVRLRNAGSHYANSPPQPATKAQFDEYVRQEMSSLARCGYDYKTARLVGTTNTSALLNCMYPSDPKLFGYKHELYVTRGLYHLHIEQWLNYFPAHRTHFIRFSDIIQGDSTVMQDLASFFCVRPYPADLLRKYRDNAINESVGLHHARTGEGIEPGTTGYDGDNRYLPDIYPSTRRALNRFYAPANERLAEIMGTRMF